MGVFGSILGGILTMGGLFLSIWIIWTITNTFLIFLLFPLFGLLGGIALGSLNSRKARTQDKYRNEYTVYAAMAFAAIVFLGLYYFIFGMDAVAQKNDTEIFEDEVVIVLGMVSGFLMEFGLGLAVANMLAENTGY